MSDTHEWVWNREKATKKQRPFGVWCPLCSACPGVMCHTWGGRETLPHRERVVATYRR